MKVMVLGSGGREHAITWALSNSPKVDELYVLPGNGGTASIAQNIPRVDICDSDALVNFALDHAIDLVVIGPEAPLVAGVADELRQAGFAVFGPDGYSAQLEGSKTFAKEFMLANDLPTAAYGSFTDKDEALAYLAEHPAPIVVKADGLAGGKGVVVAQDDETAVEAVEYCFADGYGGAGKRVVIEECLEGPECSLLAFVSGGSAACMATAQDHKRAYDGDLGPNTGGMGVYSPVPMVTHEQFEVMTDVMQRAAAAAATGDFKMDYRGVLYGGFMLTKEDPKLLEFNARFGDPETQVILPRLETDLAEVMLAVAQGRPHDVSLSWKDAWAVCVVLASDGYPGSYETGKVILGIDEAEALDDVIVFHAGTSFNADGELVTAGGRVLNVVALGATFEQARALAYKACDLINFEGKQLRHDIGLRAAEYFTQSAADE